MLNLLSCYKNTTFIIQISRKRLNFVYMNFAAMNCCCATTNDSCDLTTCRSTDSLTFAKSVWQHKTSDSSHLNLHKNKLGQTNGNWGRDLRWQELWSHAQPKTKTQIHTQTKPDLVWFSSLQLRNNNNEYSLRKHILRVSTISVLMQAFQIGIELQFYIRFGCLALALALTLLSSWHASNRQR